MRARTRRREAGEEGGRRAAELGDDLTIRCAAGVDSGGAPSMSATRGSAWKSAGTWGISSESCLRIDSCAAAAPPYSANGRPSSRRPPRAQRHVEEEPPHTRVVFGGDGAVELRRCERLDTRGEACVGKEARCGHSDRGRARPLVVVDGESEDGVEGSTAGARLVVSLAGKHDISEGAEGERQRRRVATVGSKHLDGSGRQPRRLREESERRAEVVARQARARAPKMDVATWEEGGRAAARRRAAAGGGRGAAARGQSDTA